jgi:hypothetical protein
MKGEAVDHLYEKTLEKIQDEVPWHLINYRVIRYSAYQTMEIGYTRRAISEFGERALYYEGDRTHFEKFASLCERCRDGDVLNFIVGANRDYRFYHKLLLSGDFTALPLYQQIKLRAMVCVGYLPLPSPPGKHTFFQWPEKQVSSQNTDYSYFDNLFKPKPNNSNNSGDDQSSKAPTNDSHENQSTHFSVSTGQGSGGGVSSRSTRSRCSKQTRNDQNNNVPPPPPQRVIQAYPAWWRYYECLLKYSRAHANTFDIPIETEFVSDENENLRIGLWLFQEKEVMDYYYDRNPERFNHLQRFTCSSSQLNPHQLTEIDKTAPNPVEGDEEEDEVSLSYSNSSDSSESKVKYEFFLGEIEEKQQPVPITDAFLEKVVAFEYMEDSEYYLGLGKIIDYTIKNVALQKLIVRESFVEESDKEIVLPEMKIFKHSNSSKVIEITLTDEEAGENSLFVLSCVLNSLFLYISQVQTKEN